MANIHRRLSGYLNDGIELGVDPQSGEPVTVPLEALYETSMHIIGAAGFGKSYYLRHLIDEFVRLGQPFGVIDPHRELFEYALDALNRSPVQARKVVLVDPADTEYAVAFNPLSCGISDPAEATSMVMDAFLKAWGAESFDQTPRLERILSGTMRMLIEAKFSMLEAYEFLNVDNAPFRRALRERVPDEFIRQEWCEFEKLSRQDKLLMVESTRNRLRRFLQNDRLQLMLAQTERALNLRQVLDDGKYLLANLGSVSSPESQRLLGALLVNGIFHAAKQRNSRNRRDWFLIIDEAGEFATSDVARSLKQNRKFGVHLVLAHQQLQDLENEGREVLAAVMTNAKIKVVFGGLSREDAERMAKELFTGKVSGTAVKHRSVQTKFRPTLDTFEVITESSSVSEGIGESETEGDSESSAQSESSSVSQDFAGDPAIVRDDDEFHWTLGTGSGQSQSRSASHSRSTSQQSSRTEGVSRSIVPITIHEEFHEETGRQFFSIEEQWEQRIAQLHQLPKRHAFLKIYNQPAVHIVSPDVEPERLDRSTQRYHNKARQECPYLTPVRVVVKEIEARKERIAELIENCEQADRPFDVKSFKEK